MGIKMVKTHQPEMNTQLAHVTRAPELLNNLICTCADGCDGLALWLVNGVRYGLENAIAKHEFHVKVTQKFEFDV